MSRVRLIVLTLLLAACGQDDPTIGQQPDEQATEQPSTQADWTFTAVEYEFQGAPVLLSEGEFTFTLENQGQERHELYLFYTTSEQPMEELLDLPDRQVNQVTQAVDRAEANPGQTDEFTAALVPGRFGYVCFVEAADGTPHAFLGMAGEFTVA